MNIFVINVGGSRVFITFLACPAKVVVHGVAMTTFANAACMCIKEACIASDARPKT